MSVYRYEIINPTVNPKRPFFNHKNGLFYVPVGKKYNYYLECATYNEVHGGREYYILLSNVKFNEHCRRCTTDGYKRCQINVKGEIKDYIIEETANRGNVDVEYVETCETYDIYSVV